MGEVYPFDNEYMEAEKMKRFFSLFLIIALISVAMILVACGKTEETPVSEEYHEHVLTSNVLKPTCISGGYTEYTCSECDYYFRDTFTNVVESAHNFGNGKYVTTTEATCSQPKVEERTCSICGFVDVKTGNTVSHNYNIIITTVDKTCTENGYTTKKCQWCEETKDMPIAARHEFEKWVIDVPNFHNGKCVYGLKHRTCEDCGYTESAVIAPHSLKNVGTVKATCAEMGYDIYQCEHCEFSYFDNYKAATNKHSFGSWGDYADYEGYEVRHCNTCGCTEYRAKED